ncbi:metal ABC transporter substrate-binding protein [Nocardioides jiangxiensis]|uniref:Metal ABC transporter substrate-binding protein n=1 Tax=Nocardioides jiangxiensis TaxID=3064524 RepID=A0ABT9AXX6_9ACTN|nr:metal ABC transporter substrate-binding protein [Nocardioides sp. WY-20]MDO7867158.1 metal ABC transporter substrate-binding protein [Nocardioides sp. WY-20]
MFSPVTRTAARPLLATILAVSAASGLAACGVDSPGSGRLQVVAAFYPLQYAVERVTGGNADVTNLTQPGKEPHDLELSVHQVAEVAKADLVVYEAHFQAAVDAAVDDNRTGPSVDAAAHVDLLPAPDPHGHEADGEEHGDLDPHFWQDPLRMASLGDALAKELGTVDPEHAREYTRNAAALRSDLVDLDAAYRTGLASCQRDTIVVNHDAFGYLGTYGLHIEAISGLSPDAEPTASTLQHLHDLIRSHHLTTVFSETLVSPRAADAIAGDLGIHTAVLDPLEGLTSEAEQNGGDYLTVMRQNLALLKKANGC